MSITGEEFANTLKAGADGLQEKLALKLLAFAKEVEASAKENFVGDDVPRRIRVKNTSHRRNGGPIGSWYRDYSNAPPTSGRLLGPRAITGNLRSSILGELAMVDGNPAAIITAGRVKPVKYAAALEFGVPRKRIEPRMYLGRAFDNHIDDLKDDLKEMLFVSIVGI